MDRRARVFDPTETFKASVDGITLGLWTAIPGIVVKVPGTAGGPMTVDVQPTINGMLLDPETLLYSPIQMPVLQDCLLGFQGGGGATLTFPVAVDDECLVVFSSRCIDGWYQRGGVQNQAVMRHHSLSDGIAYVGLKSLPNAFSFDTANVCLTSNDQQTFIKLNPTGQTVAVQAKGGMNLNGVTIDQNGNLHSPATITGQTDVKNGVGTSLTSHVHPNVQSGTTPTPPPTPGS